MVKNRRDFIKLGGLSALALTMPVKKLSSLMDDGMFSAGKKIPEFGLQLYAVKEDIAKDPKGTLKQLASFGYNYVESFEGDNGMFWGLGDKEFKKHLDGLGIKILSSHCDYQKDFEKKAAEAGEIGMKYLICPSIGPQKSIDEFKRIAGEFNKAGEICKKNGMRFAYHNHDYPFRPVDGQVPIDVLLNNTDKNLVDFQMDIYWIVVAGANPEAYLKKYKNRFRLCHIKDGKKDAKGANITCDLGNGIVDFPKVLRTASDNGMQYYIVEQEHFVGSTPLKSAAADAGYMKKFEMK